MKNVHILPTDKPSRLFYNVGGALLFTSYENHNGVNIYITSDEEIKEGDYSFYPPFGVGKNIVINGELCFHIESKNDKGSFTQRTYQTLDENKKIILTTDPDLINDGVQAIDDEFLEWFVKNPSCEEVEIFNAVGYTQTLYFIVIPKEEPKQETLEEAGEKLYPNRESFVDRFQNIERLAFIEGAKWQQEQDRWKTVLEETPPSNIELLVQSPEGIVHLSSWRESYNIFSCQDKSESSSDWKWKTI